MGELRWGGGGQKFRKFADVVYGWSLVSKLATAAVLQSLKACLLTESISIIALVFTLTEQ